MYKRGHVIALQYPMKTEELKCMGFVFIEYIDLIAIVIEDETRETVCYKQQRIMSFMKKILNITGGFWINKNNIAQVQISNLYIEKTCKVGSYFFGNGTTYPDEVRGNKN